MMLRLGAVGEKFGVAGPSEARQGPGFLADRAGDDRIHPSRVGRRSLRVRDGFLHERLGEMARRSVGARFGRWEKVGLVEVDDGDRWQQGSAGSFARMGDPVPVRADAGTIGGQRQELVAAVDDEPGLAVKRGVGERLHDHLGSDPQGIAHRDADDGNVLRIGHETILRGSPPVPATELEDDPANWRLVAFETSGANVDGRAS